MKIHPFRLLSIWLLTLLLAIMLTSFIVNANQEEIVVKEIEYILMTETEYEEVYEDENELQSSITEPTKISLGMSEVTAYCGCELCCGEWADGYTFTGDLATEGVTIATYPDDIPLGSKVFIEGVGERIAQDIGGAIHNKRIDVFFSQHSDALAFGRQNLEVWGVE